MAMAHMLLRLRLLMLLRRLLLSVMATADGLAAAVNMRPPR